MNNSIFFVFSASIFGIGVSLFEYDLKVSSITPIIMIVIGFIGMIMTIKGLIKELEYGDSIPYFIPCRKCIWSKPIFESKRIKGYMCVKNPFNHIYMDINDKHSDRKYKVKRAKK